MHGTSDGSGAVVVLLFLCGTSLSLPLIEVALDLFIRHSRGESFGVLQSRRSDLAKKKEEEV